ncbi:LuxR C-terminal-related transcriptional regulator [Streptomyces sp. SL13]|uniref:LuxR C-terminal-related transcriptional regulator n=1 Tax=Streptantibioticus silvisoli TaxID=2705255 RepID=A0AA90JY85_9ACTN|nr:LuxR C-terminal-related transcriptional regulator [Streptantibioticus silvisoli]MDI5961157.1 LuxR C-terminal-related transcriptional regulator [Streptantibioticus silvisoli]MDI5970961.1 LuxR C-terminal-related transcriptional regulator [Streptantibioticus silvisoli]
MTAFEQSSGGREPVEHLRPGTLLSPRSTARPPARRIPVAVYAEDLILHAGLVQQLRQRPEVELLTLDASDGAVVSLTVADRLNESVVEHLRRLQRGGTVRVGLVVGHFEPSGLQTVVECGVAAVLRRCDADQDRLVHLVTALANGEGVMPGDLLGQLLDHVGSLQRTMLDPRGLTLSPLTTREAEMLRLVADGFDTSQIAARTAYSERTVKNVLHEVSTRFGLRNRAHAVGYAMRHGLI